MTKQIVSLLGGGGSGGASSIGTAGLQAAITANTAALTANTAALNGASTSAASLVEGGTDFSGGGGENSGGGIFGSLLGGFSSLLGIASLASNLFSLFGGPKQVAQPTPYLAPQAVSLEVANGDNILAGLPRVDTAADGTPRTFDATPGAAASQPVHVTVNVSAIDSRSFSDYAPQMADAVRQAMLNMSPINQVIRESL